MPGAVRGEELRSRLQTNLATCGKSAEPAYYSPDMRRFAVPVLASAVAVAVLALLAFGLANQGTNSSLDARVSRGDYPPAPKPHAHLPILGAAG